MDIIKSFTFNSEGIELVLKIKKETFKGALKMFIVGEVKYDNSEIITTKSVNGSTKSLYLSYKKSSFFSISTNDWKGFRCGQHDIETKFSIYRNVTEMKEAYIEQREFITPISNYFYDGVKKYKELKLLYETPIDEILSD